MIWALLIHFLTFILIFYFGYSLGRFHCKMLDKIYVKNKLMDEITDLESNTSLHFDKENSKIVYDFCDKLRKFDV